MNYDWKIIIRNSRFIIHGFYLLSPISAQTVLEKYIYLFPQRPKGLIS